MKNLFCYMQDNRKCGSYSGEPCCQVANLLQHQTLNSGTRPDSFDIVKEVAERSYTAPVGGHFLS